MCTDVFTLVWSRFTISGRCFRIMPLRRRRQRGGCVRVRWRHSARRRRGCCVLRRASRAPGSVEAASCGGVPGASACACPAFACARARVVWAPAAPIGVLRGRCCRLRAGALTPREGGRQCAPARTRERARGPAPPLPRACRCARATAAPVLRARTQRLPVRGVRRYRPRCSAVSSCCACDANLATGLPVLTHRWRRARPLSGPCARSGACQQCLHQVLRYQGESRVCPARVCDRRRRLHRRARALRRVEGDEAKYALALPARADSHKRRGRTGHRWPVQRHTALRGQAY